MDYLKIIERIDEIIARAETELLTAVVDSKEEAFEIILKALRKYADGSTLKSGQTSAAVLNALDKQIQTALKNAGYFEAVDEYLINFDQIESNLILLHKNENNIRLTLKELNPVKQLAVLSSMVDLERAGLQAAFIEPVKKELVRQITLGNNIIDAERRLEAMVLGSGEQVSDLERYVGQVARDALSQFDGSIHQHARNKHNLTTIEYIGSLVKDSRGQCAKWVAKGVLQYEDLAEEIAWAMQKGNSYNGRKVSGMIPMTIPDTFLIYRGGYRCRHEGFPRRI